MNPNLNASLKKIGEKIQNKDTEHLFILDENGKIIFKQTDDEENKVDAYKNFNGIQEKDFINYVSIHNHPLIHTIGSIPDYSSFSKEDLWTTYIYNLKGAYAVDKFYLYQMLRPKTGYKKIKNKDFTQYYLDTSDSITKKMQNDVLNGKISLKYFYVNWSDILNQKIADHFGWTYKRITNPWKTEHEYLKGEAVPYSALPKWIRYSKNPNKNKIINIYKNKYKKAIKEIPELEQYYDYK